MEHNDNSNKNYRFLLQKELRKSDVSNSGRILLPKKYAEARLPPLEENGIILDMEDMTSSQIWHLRYKFWSNNQSRMYILENTGEFVKTHGLEVGDYMVLYTYENKWVIEGKKVGQTSRQQSLRANLTMNDNSNKNYRFLFQKELRNADVSNFGRIVLPKKDAETHLPPLEEKDGIILDMEDMTSSQIWHLRYKFWPNNQSRMYILENTGEFVKTHGLEVGDYMVLYTYENKWVIEGKKVVQTSRQQTDNNHVSNLCEQI